MKLKWPIFQKGHYKVEKVQKRAAKLIRRLEDHSYDSGTFYFRKEMTIEEHDKRFIKLCIVMETAEKRNLCCS